MMMHHVSLCSHFGGSRAVQYISTAVCSSSGHSQYLMTFCVCVNGTNLLSRNVCSNVVYCVTVILRSTT